MYRYIKFFFALAVTIPIAYFFALPIGLISHSLSGNTHDVIAADLEHTNVHFLLTFLGSILLMLVFINVHVWSRRDIYRRNRDAALLARKYTESKLLGKSVMTDDEEARYHRYKSSGVLAYNSYGVMRVSDLAYSEFWD